MNHRMLSIKDMRFLDRVSLKGSDGHTNNHGLKKRVIDELKSVGVGFWGLMRLETQYLVHVIHETEHIRGAAYGRNQDGFVMLVATDKRVIYLDCKPLFEKSQDIGYDVVGGVELDWIGVNGVLTLNTRFGDYTVRMFNKKAAEIFRDYVEMNWIETQNDLNTRHKY